jgi:hypothetical protein
MKTDERDRSRAAQKRKFETLLPLGEWNRGKRGLHGVRQKLELLYDCDMQKPTTRTTREPHLSLAFLIRAISAIRGRSICFLA